MSKCLYLTGLQIGMNLSLPLVGDKRQHTQKYRAYGMVFLGLEKGHKLN